MATVAEIMSGNLLTVAPSTSVADVVKQMRALLPKKKP